MSHEILISAHDKDVPFAAGGGTFSFHKYQATNLSLDSHLEKPAETIDR